MQMIPIVPKEDDFVPSVAEFEKRFYASDGLQTRLYIAHMHNRQKVGLVRSRFLKNMKFPKNLYKAEFRVFERSGEIAKHMLYYDHEKNLFWASYDYWVKALRVKVLVPYVKPIRIDYLPPRGMITLD